MLKNNIIIKCVWILESNHTRYEGMTMVQGQSYKYYNEFMRKGRYAEYISVEETIERMKGEEPNGRNLF